MNEIQAALLAVLPPKRKSTSGGWTSFDAVCCHHRGEGRDTRQRGGIIVKADTWSYHCFNCGFKAGWSPGKLLSKNTKDLFRWSGMPDDQITKLGLYALKLKEDQPSYIKELKFDLNEVELPDGTMSIKDWVDSPSIENFLDDLVPVMEYISSRGFDPLDGNFMWSPTAGYKDRVIIPFYSNQLVVGFTGRKIKDGKPKYLTDSQSGYVFNLDNQAHNRKYVIVVEGQFDALAIDGVAIMTNEPNDVQIARINALGKKVICVPDKDKPGAKLIHHAVNNGWSVSLPEWGNDVKDVADAMCKFGRLYTLFTIIHYCEDNKIKMQLLAKKLENINE
jgi:hypothetical protein